MKLSAGQKKALGMVLIIIMSLINLLFLIVLIADLLDTASGGQHVIEVLFVMAIFYFPLQYGIKLWKSGVSDSLPVPAADPEKVIQLQVKISLADYRVLILKLSYMNPIVQYMTVIGLGMLIAFLTNGGDGSGSYFPIALMILFLSFPALIYLLAARGYNSSAYLKESSSYEINSTNISIMSPSSSTTLTWSSLYKVKEISSYFLLYTNQAVAIVIPKSSFQSTEDIDALRLFALNVKDIRREVKYPR